MNDTRNSKKEKKQHIQVYIRVRPINDSERIGKSVTVVDIPSNKEIVVRDRSPYDKFTKKFTFDKVFGPNSKQLEVYNVVVSPLVEEVLAGYNCTVFAYGQTGTGKTFTMEGTNNDPSLHWQKDTLAGIIPRALSHLFDELRILEVQEYSIRVSFLELYNEEIFDLLSPSDEAAKIRIYEDPTKKGSVIVHGLEEMPIHTKIEVFKILQRGSEKRQTAATLMNAHSSRSHTIFSITIHIKEYTIDGEELVKTGKLNLVDLAGSENIGKSGAVDRRAREAGNINQSLLTLSRVITALIEKTPHVPYRESKLTRLLQESLGGRTRTSIIATVSPASINLEETLSTLDYAHRAKNITNRPEINQKFSKKALLQEYIAEIEKLKKDLLATRERNGIYLNPDSYNEMQSLIELQSKEIEEKLHYIKALEEAMHFKEQLFNKLKSKNSEQAHELQNTTNQLESTVNALMITSSYLAVSEQEKEEQKYLVEKHASTENILLSQVQKVLDVADTATADVHKLHDKVFRKIQVGQQNNCLGQQFKKYIKDRIVNIEADVSEQAETLIKFCTFVKENIDAQSISLNEAIDKSIQTISGSLVNSVQNITDELKRNINDANLKHQQWFEDEIKNVTTVADKERRVSKHMFSITEKIKQLLENKIAENCHVLNADTSCKIDSLTESAKELITSIFIYSNEKCDRLNNNIEEVKENIENIRQSQNTVMKEHANFAKVMEDLQRCFNELQKEEKENYSLTHDALNDIDETCSIVNNQISNTCRINIENGNHVQEKLQDNLETVKREVAVETEKAWTLTENTVAQSKVLIDQFQAYLGKNCDTVANYKNCVERSIRELEQKMEEDKSPLLSAINDVYMTVYNASDKHAKCLNICKTAFMNVCMEVSKKLEYENTSAANTNSRIIAEIQSIRNQVDKFFVEDLFRDVPTGYTPVRKSFQYPRKLIKTSPPERILNRYREALKEINDDKEHETTFALNNNTEINKTVNAT
ncbi:kinesin-like protein Klp61F [Megachile rotundata]|uniref:kinesin-like protein Klp61F n=1 Tax=Megachile rotundata TaxID=143995 RepID=UPI000614F780|nr:PREDICTED: bipolar kinesin KRP-130-like [Megachile rotundata]